MTHSLQLKVLSGEFAVCRGNPPSDLAEAGRLAAALTPGSQGAGELWSLTVTADEVSLVCDVGSIPPGLQAESEWRAMRVQGTLDFSLVGILAQMTAALANAGVSVFAVSTFDTDYLLVRSGHLSDAVQALQAAGCDVNQS